MKRKRFSKSLRGFTARITAALVAIAIIFSMVTVLGLVSFAEEKEQMFAVLSNEESESNEANVVLPIVFSTAATTDQYFMLTFDANMIEGDKPIVGTLKINTQASKFRVNAYHENVENEDDGDSVNDTASAPDLYCKYDETTKKYTAVIKLKCNTKISGTNDNHNDICGYITIGNTEYAGTATSGEATTDKSVEFVFARPELKLLQYDMGSAKWVTSGNNLLALPSKITTGSIGFDKNYLYSTTAYSKADIKTSAAIDGKTPLVMSPKNIVGTTNNTLVSALEYNANLSMGHSYIYHEEEEPTTESIGTMAYYTCDCGDCEGKRFSAKTQESEILNFAELEIPQATEKMIVVEKNEKVSNIVVPFNMNAIISKLDDPTVVTGGNETYDVYAKLRFKARVFSGEKPIIGVVAKDGKDIKPYKDNADNANNTVSANTLYCYYDPSTLQYEAVVKFTTNSKSKNNDCAITIGNAEHDSDGLFDTTDYDVSFAMTQPELYVVDSSNFGISFTDNLLNSVNSYNTKFTDENGSDIIFEEVSDLLDAPKNDYSRDGKYNTVIKSDIPETFFATTHTFAFEPALASTKTTDGRKAYYHATCTEENCCFKDKLYLDKGYTETTEEELNTGKFKMITISKDNYSSVFVPLDIASYANANHIVKSGYVFLKLSFTARMLEGKKPIIARIRGSSDKGGNYSWSEPDYADNTDETYDGVIANSSIDNIVGPDLYSHFDENTNKFEAVICLRVNQSWSTLSNGIHDAILIGHAEYNGGVPTAESDSTVAFSFCDPELYLMNATTGEVDKSTGNLIPDICEENLNFGKEYKHNGNPCSLSNNPLSAPRDKWSIIGNKSDVKSEEIPEKYFNVYKWVFHKQEDPTATKNGKKAYYTCECSDNTCMYKDKLYSDKGVTEVREEDLLLTYSKMIKIGGGANNNVFIPLDLKQYLKRDYQDSTGGYCYVRLSFTARMIEGNKPIVSRVRGSSDQGGDYSWSEPDYVDNDDEEYSGIEAKNEEKTKFGPDLYCKYYPETCTYTAIIRLGVGISWSTLSNGVHDAILIGNAEHNGKGYSSETDSDVSFYFSNPTLYFVNATTGETDYSTGNLIAPICEETLNFDKEYSHYDNPCKLSNHLLSAPKNMWSIDGSKNNIIAENIPENFFKYYNFVYHKQVDPTTDKEGTRAYYACECSDDNCQYKDKLYSDKGLTEITDVKLGKAKMITVGGGANNNVFVPLNLKPFANSANKANDGYYYLRLTFTARMISGDKPIVSRIRGSSDIVGDASYSEQYDADNNYSENDFAKNGTPNLYTKYDPKTLKYEAVVRIRVGVSWSTLSNGIHDAILIGNAEHNGTAYSGETDSSVSFSFCDPKLYFINAKNGEIDESTGNLIAPICDQTLNIGKDYIHNVNPCKEENHLLSAPKDMWSVDGKHGNFSASTISEDYFKYYNFVYHERQNPTITTEGMVAHYTCECEDESCKYKGKYYSDKGLTEIKNASMSKTKMITVGGGANNNVFVPLNLKPVANSKYKAEDGYYYLRLTFKARMFSGDKPVVSRIRGASNFGGDFSYTEKDDVDNFDDVNDGFEDKGNSKMTPDLYCKYYPETCTYTAIIRLQIGVDYSTVSNGVHDAILIGNAEHNGASYTSETDSSTSFAFCEPELYFVNAKENSYVNKETGEVKDHLEATDNPNDYIAPGEVDESTGNLLPPICDQTLNFTKEYINNTTEARKLGTSTQNPCTASNNVITAPKDMWSIDGSKDNFSSAFLNTPQYRDEFFKDYEFVYHKAVRPTSTSSGSKAYYSCDEGMYKGKCYSDKGLTEISSGDLYLGTTKMILIGENTPGQSKITNVFVPLNLKSYVQAKHKDQSGYSYVRLSFNAKMLSGSVPIVQRMRGSSDKKDENGDAIQGSWSEPDYSDNDDHTYDGIEEKNESGTTTGPDLYTYYDAETMRYTAIIRIACGFSWSTLSNGVHDAIMIGNAEHNGPGTKEHDYNVSFLFSDPEMYLLDAQTGEVDESTGNLIAPICDETLNFDKVYAHTTDNPCHLENHILSAPQDMWSIDGNEKLVSVYEYTDDFFKTSNKTTALTVNNGNSDSIISTKCNLQPKTRYKIDIDYTEENNGKLKVGFMLLNGSNTYVSAADLGLTVETPNDNVSGQHYSAVITMPSSDMLGNLDKNFKLVIGAKGGNVTFANVKIRPVNLSGKYGNNVLANGDFRLLTSQDKLNEQNKQTDDATKAQKLSKYEFWYLENETESEKLEADIVNEDTFSDTTPVGAYVSGSTGKITTSLSLKANTNYVFRFGSKYNSEAMAKPIVTMKTASGTVSTIGKYSHDVASKYNTVYKFKTPANLSKGNNTTVGVNIDSADIDGVFSGFEVFELASNGTDTGNNLISDPYFITAKTTKGKESNSIWEVSGGLKVEFKEISIFYFNILKSNLLIFSGKNGYDSHLSGSKVEYGGETQAFIENTATVQNGKSYIFTVNYKFANAMTTNTNIGPELLCKSGSGYTKLNAKKTVSEDEYKDTYIFTATGISEGEDNFKFRFNVSGALTSGYLANALLYEYDGNKAIGEQLMENGNFATGDASEWTLSANSGHFYQYKFTEFPDNYFSKTNAPKPSMIIYRNPADYAHFMQHLMIKPNAKYQLEYKHIGTAAKYEDKLPYISLYYSQFNKNDDGSYVFKSDGVNVSSTTVPYPSSKLTYLSEDGFVRRFVTDDEISTTGDGNIIVFLSMREGNAGYWGEVELYELDENDNKIGNNLLLNGDFTLGTAGWTLEKDVTYRVVEQPDGFFSGNYKNTPDTMVYSNGSLSNQTYGNTFSLSQGNTYYFTGNYVNMNSQGVTPQIRYQTADGKYKTLSTDLFYDSDRYYFEIAFSVPEDALVVDGLTKMQVQMNNNDHGKGYFCNLMLTEGNKYKNMFDGVGFIGANSNYSVIPYDESVFVFYYDDSVFNDGDWSGEATLTTSNATGVVTDEEFNPISGIKMVLNNGVYSATTDASGNYTYNNIKPGDYSLYLVSPKDGTKILCLEFTVEESKTITLPRVIYSKVKNIVEVDGEVVSKSKCMIKALLFDADGKVLPDVPIYIEDNGYATTNNKGIATFDNLTNFGEKEIYINLDDGTKYVFRKVEVVGGKGLKIKLMFDPDGSDNTLMYVLIFGGAGLVLLAGIALAVILIIKKKKAKIV